MTGLLARSGPSSLSHIPYSLLIDGARSRIVRYLPPYTSFLPVKDGNGGRPHGTERSSEPRRRGALVENVVFSQLSYLVIFIIVLCITEREKVKKDPLNFSVLNIVVEVIRYHFLSSSRDPRLTPWSLKIFRVNRMIFIF